MHTHVASKHIFLALFCLTIFGASLCVYQKEKLIVSQKFQDSRSVSTTTSKTPTTTTGENRRHNGQTDVIALPTSTVSTSTSATAPAIMTSASNVRNATEVMAWMYPGTPACGAAAEIADGRKIDVLKVEYFTINDLGALTLLTETEAGCNGYSAKNVAELKKYSKVQYVTVSSNYAGSMELFLTGNQSAAVDTLVSFATTNDLTGVELDFEDFGGWGGDRYALYKEFVSLLGTALHAKSKKLMVDGPAVSNAIEEAWYPWRYQDFTGLPVDHIVVMAYDYQFDHGVGNPISPLSWIENVIVWTSKQYPDKSKIVIGLPSYGYRGTEGTQKITLQTYEQTKKETGFATATRDTSSGEMTWRVGATRYFYQDSESLRQKRALVEKLGINSISVWHLGGNLWF